MQLRPHDVLPFKFYAPRVRGLTLVPHGFRGPLLNVVASRYRHSLTCPPVLTRHVFSIFPFEIIEPSQSVGPRTLLEIATRSSLFSPPFAVRLTLCCLSAKASPPPAYVVSSSILSFTSVCPTLFSYASWRFLLAPMR